MIDHSLTKAQRRELRRLNSLAHERELGAAAGRLHEEFDRWRRGEMDVFDLNEHIHRFHDGISRELYKRYVMGEADWNVASAVVREVLKEAEIDPAVLEALGRQIAFLDRGQIGEAGVAKAPRPTGSRIAQTRSETREGS